jgi:hypothetical protein
MCAKPKAASPVQPESKPFFPLEIVFVDLADGKAPWHAALRVRE